jgi:hypothetical protein
VLRSRLFCSLCNRRLSGKQRTTTARTLTYYQCPHDPGIRRRAAAHPDHRTVTVREEPVLDAITGFYAERVFGPDRTALLAAIIPATTAAQIARTTARTKALRKKLDKIDVAETALITELETPADPDDPAAQALRNRIRARFTELYTERTAINADLAALEATVAEPVDDPTLLDELPILGTNTSSPSAPPSPTPPSKPSTTCSPTPRRPQPGIRPRPYQARSDCPFSPAHWVVPGRSCRT